MKNVLYEPQNFLAKLSDGRIVSVRDVMENNITDHFSCSCCNQELTLRARDSIYMQPHFRHANGMSCVEYKKENSLERKDIFYKREMALGDAEVEEIKERVKALEYIYVLYQKIRESGQTEENKELFLKAFSLLDCRDQLFIFEHGKNTICLKWMKKDMADTVNKSIQEYLRKKYSSLDFYDFSIPHCAWARYKGCSFRLGNIVDFYHPPLIFINENDLDEIEENIPRKIMDIDEKLLSFQEQKKEILEFINAQDGFSVTFDGLSYNIFYKSSEMEEEQRFSYYDEFSKVETYVKKIKAMQEKHEQINKKLPLLKSVYDLVTETFGNHDQDEIMTVIYDSKNLKKNHLGLSSYISDYFSYVSFSINVRCKPSEEHYDTLSELQVIVDGNLNVTGKEIRPSRENCLFTKKFDSPMNCANFVLEKLRERRKLIEKSKKWIYQNSARIPSFRIRESKNKENHIMVYCHDEFQEYLVEMNKKCFLSDEKYFYPIVPKLTSYPVLSRPVPYDKISAKEKFRLLRLDLNLLDFYPSKAQIKQRKEEKNHSKEEETERE